MGNINILVIGNGFDLAHHLPTQYRDFLEFVNAYKEHVTSDYTKALVKIRKIRPELYKEIGSLINHNILIDYFLSIYKERCAGGKTGWIDFESEISAIVQKLDEAKKQIEGKMSGPNDRIMLEKGLFDYLKFFIAFEKSPETTEVLSIKKYQPVYFDNLANKIYESLNRLIRLLEIFLYEYVEKLECNFRLPEMENLTIDHVLSFNYTDTYRKYYDREKRAEYCYIHGEAKESNVETCNLVLGIDEYLPSDRVDSDNQFVWFKKFYQRIFKRTGSEYLDWINQFEKVNREAGLSKTFYMDIYIYGHSLDVTDKDVLSKLILTENTNTYIYYHSREAMANQISNLVKIIGEANLIQMTGGRDRRIHFILTKAPLLERTKASTP